jgi:hypothetical protein
MSKDGEYRQYAAEAFDLAQRIPNATDRACLLVMARGWLDLAERCMHQPEPPILEHPLVSETFRRT